MFEKSAVKEANGNPLYDELAASWGQRRKWNFHKYLVDRNGKMVTSYPNSISPDNGELVRRIEDLVAKQ